MKISVRVKTGHPTGTYRRGGRVFSSSTPTVLEERDLKRAELEAIVKDPWLAVGSAAEEKPRADDRGDRDAKKPETK